MEYFHLLFLRSLAAGANRTRFTLKGGCNLRFFFDSPRYSEDMDLDAAAVPKATLKNMVDRLLESPLLLSPLRARGLELGEVTAPKQTETTQRWKIALELRGQSVPVRTKVEFSHRRGADEARVEPVNLQLLREYGVPTLLVQHYPAEAAILQKLRALAGRPLTQARDVFDLGILFARPLGGPRVEEGDAALLEAAIDRAMSLSWADFKGQVLAYLTPAEQELYGDEATWTQLQLDVCARLDELRR